MRKRILLVDDEPRNIELLARCLAPLDVDTLVARDGREALAIFAAERIDLILLDLRMPEVDGVEVLAHVRSDPVYVPVVMVTASTERTDRLRALEAGADDVLEKPLDREVLIARVRTLLRLKETTDDLEERTRELAAQNEALATLQLQQRELAQFIVHDLKNPIATLYANIAWLLEVVTARADIAEALLDTESAARRLKSMVDDLLTIARLEEAAAPVQRAKVALETVIDDILRAHHREVEEARVSFKSEVPPLLTLDVDAVMLRRMLSNLVENAVRHARAGGRILVQASGEDPVEVTIANTGKPIADEDRDRIFRKFGRGSGQPVVAGNVGLGLYFCKLAIEAHGGSIALDSTAEWPVRFTLRFPSAGLSPAEV
jgi:two-component system sensor histidine kinase/response regulator